MTHSSNFYTSNQFAIFRIIFGIYLTFHFWSLINFGPELFGSNGMIPTPSLNPTWGYFPFFNHEFDQQITFLLQLLTLSSFMFTCGIFRRFNSLFMFYGWCYLFNRNVLIANPGLAYVGWLLLACAIIPSGEGHYIWSPFKRGRSDWFMPPIIYWSAWFLVGLGYTISGIHKLQCPSWIDGTALYHVLNSLLARDNFIRDLFLQFPIILTYMSYFSIFLEISFLPLGLFYYTRKWYWTVTLLFHLGILTVINFTDLTLGVLMMHFFIFDYRFLPKKNIKVKLI